MEIKSVKKKKKNFCQSMKNKKKYHFKNKEKTIKKQELGIKYMMKIR